MKENNASISVEKNKKSNITINYNVIDELSCDNIRRNYDKVVELENEFSDRLEYSKEIFTKKLLPTQLQSDFNIEPKLVNGKIVYETKAITPEAYRKFPLKMNYTMKFNSIEEANEFRKNGIAELQRIADLTQKPVEIPNITNMKEFLGEFENPVSSVSKYGASGIKLYICPQPIPPAQKYKIEIFNDKISFKLETSLKISSFGDDVLELSNNESESEPFNVKIKLTGIKKALEENLLQGKFNLTISLREKYYNDCELNKEIIKFRFLMEDNNNCILIDNVELKANVFYFEHCGEKTYTQKEYKQLENTLKLIDKVIYISKIKKIEIDYNIEEFIKNEEIINFVYNAIGGKNYKTKNSMTNTITLDKDVDMTELLKNNGKIAFRMFLNKITLLGHEIQLKDYYMTMYDSVIEELPNDDSEKKIAIRSSNIEYELIKENKKD